MFYHVCSHAIWPNWAAMILASGSVSERNGIFVLRLFQLQVFFYNNYRWLVQCISIFSSKKIRQMPLHSDLKWCSNLMLYIISCYKKKSKYLNVKIWIFSIYLYKAFLSKGDNYSLKIVTSVSSSWYDTSE